MLSQGNYPLTFCNPVFSVDMNVFLRGTVTSAEYMYFLWEGSLFYLSAFCLLLYQTLLHCFSATWDGLVALQFNCRKPEYIWDIGLSVNLFFPFFELVGGIINNKAALKKMVYGCHKLPLRSAFAITAQPMHVIHPLWT